MCVYVCASVCVCAYCPMDFTLYHCLISFTHSHACTLSCIHTRTRTCASLHRQPRVYKPLWLLGGSACATHRGTMQPAPSLARARQSQQHSHGQGLRQQANTHRKAEGQREKGPKGEGVKGDRKERVSKCMRCGVMRNHVGIQSVRHLT